jgi:solute carrier family 15 (peptide/histidine transporter), member 3/4
MRMHSDISDTEVFTANPWNVCTVQQVEDIKQTLNVIPLWSATITSLLMQQSQSFRVLQAETMDRRFGATNFQIPAGSIGIFEVITFTLWSGCYDTYILPLLKKITGRQNVISHKQRMGIGLLFSIASALTASTVENIRRKKAITQGLEYNADGTVGMSAFWLVPQSVFSGLTTAFVSIGQVEFYYSVLPKTMGSLALALLLLACGIANIVATMLIKLVNVVPSMGGRGGWLPDNLNKGHYDYFCFLIALICIVDFMYFIACCYWFEESVPNQLDNSHEVEENRSET